MSAPGDTSAESALVGRFHSPLVGEPRGAGDVLHMAALWLHQWCPRHSDIFRFNPRPRSGDIYSAALWRQTRTQGQATCFATEINYLLLRKSRPCVTQAHFSLNFLSRCRVPLPVSASVTRMMAARGPATLGRTPTRASWRPAPCPRKQARPHITAAVHVSPLGPRSGAPQLRKGQLHCPLCWF